MTSILAKRYHDGRKYRVRVTVSDDAGYEVVALNYGWLDDFGTWGAHWPGVFGRNLGRHVRQAVEAADLSTLDMISVQDAILGLYDDHPGIKAAFREGYDSIAISALKCIIGRSDIFVPTPISRF